MCGGRAIPLYNFQWQTEAEFERQEAKLERYADQTNRCLSSEEAETFELGAYETGGGNEHFAYFVDDDDGKPWVVRRTRDPYGFARMTPAQYLKRWADVAKHAPALQTDFLCFSRGDSGRGAIWTIQPFVKGSLYSTLPAGSRAKALRQDLENAGWRQIEPLKFQNADGLIMGDVNPGNIIKGADGALYPIDVIFDEREMASEEN